MAERRKVVMFGIDEEDPAVDLKNLEVKKPRLSSAANLIRARLAGKIVEEDEEDSDEMNDQGERRIRKQRSYESSSSSSSSSISGSLSEQESIGSDYGETMSWQNAISSAMIVILEDCIHELSVMSCMCKAPKMEVSLRFKSLHERFTTNDANETLFDQVTLEFYDEAYLKKSEYTKLQKMRTWIEFLLKHVILELRCIKTTKNFQKYINAYIQYLYDEESILQDRIRNVEILADLQQQIEEEREDYIQQIQARTEEIGQIKDEYQDLLSYTKLKKDYINNWENCRVERNRMIIEKNENRYVKTIADRKDDLEKEGRVHTEMMTYLKLASEDLQEEIIKWMEKYDADLDDVNIQITKMDRMRNEQREKLVEVRALYEKRKKEIADFLVYKEKKRIENEELQRLQKAAIKIQAWWRGTMFRRGLGPYRKKKKKGGKGKDVGKGKDAGKGKKKK